MNNIKHSARFLMSVFFFAIFSFTDLASTTDVLIPANPSLPPNVPKTESKAAHIGDHVASISNMVHEFQQQVELRKAVIKQRASMPYDKEAMFEVITRNGALHNGGEFVALREVNTNSLDDPGPKNSTTPGAFPSGQPFLLRGYLPRLKDEKADKKDFEEAKAHAKAIEAEKALKQAIESEKSFAKATAEAEAASLERAKLQEEALKAKEDAQKAKEDAEKARIASEAANQQAKAAQKAAQKADSDARKNGERVQNQIRSELNRYRAEGGPYRAPSGNGSH
jgi:flagellar biosynthesis GTPase FlhF